MPSGGERGRRKPIGGNHDGQKEGAPARGLCVDLMHNDIQVAVCGGDKSRLWTGWR
jgi:hypothetical protein